MGFFRRKRHPLELETERLANVVQHQLTRLNLAYRQKIDGVVHTQQVEFVQPLIAYPTELKIEIDVQRLPRGVHITDLRDAKLLETLSVACKHPVRAEHKRGAGFWYVIERDVRAKIPHNVKMSDMLVEPKAHPLTVPFGVGEHGKKRFENIRDLPHLLIAGATGRGKSVLVNAIIGTLLHRLPPEMLQLVLVDLKGGMELGIYEDVPHVSRYCDVNTRFPQLLLDIQAEMERRTSLMKKKARDVDEYNTMVDSAERLPYIVLVVDEIANAMLLKQRITLTRADSFTYKDTFMGATEALLDVLAA
ncbi:MAG: FtsK/SpoIIIE domain-containing protein [Chloroflexota bacterium]